LGIQDRVSEDSKRQLADGQAVNPQAADRRGGDRQGYDLQPTGRLPPKSLNPDTVYNSKMMSAIDANRQRAAHRRRGADR
jgi:hypothetical protein